MLATSTHADLAQDDCRPNPTPSGRLRRDPAAHRAILEGRSYQKGPKELEFAEREAVEDMYVDNFTAPGDIKAYRAAKKLSTCSDITKRSQGNWIRWKDSESHRHKVVPFRNGLTVGFSDTSSQSCRHVYWLG